MAKQHMTYSIFTRIMKASPHHKILISAYSIKLIQMPVSSNRNGKGSPHSLDHWIPSKSKGDSNTKSKSKSNSRSNSFAFSNHVENKIQALQNEVSRLKALNEHYKKDVTIHKNKLNACGVKYNIKMKEMEKYVAELQAIKECVNYRHLKTKDPRLDACVQSRKAALIMEYDRKRAALSPI